MFSSGLCHYQMKYFKVPLVTSSTRHVYKTTRIPLEDQSSCRLQVDLKHEYILILSSGLCHYIKLIIYFKAPLVTSSTRHIHKTTKRPPEDQFSWRSQVDLKHIMNASWNCPDAFFRVMIKLTNKIFKALLDTCSTRHIYARRPNW